MTDAQQTRADLINFLRTIARPGSALGEVADDRNLVDAGIIDSLVVIHIIMYLETKHNVSLARSGIEPSEIVSIQGILNAIAKAA